MWGKCDRDDCDFERLPIETQPPNPVWYGMCGHWTADWSKLKRGSVPLCPLDSRPGFHAEETWWQDIDAYEADGHPGYRAKIEALEIP
jgi:hypothetical protein